MPTLASMKDSILGSAKTGRGKINMTVIVIAFVLAIMTINTHRFCTTALNNKDDSSKFTDDSSVKLMYYIAIVILIMCVILFGYDLAIMFELI